MSYNNPDPDPEESTGLEPGGSVPPGETPPGESSTSSGAGPYEPRTRGWGKGPLIAICVLAAVCAAFFLVYAIVVIL